VRLRDYHERTKHSEAKLRTDRFRLDFANRPVPFKLYRDLPAIPLPRELEPQGVPALDAVAMASTPGERRPTLAEIARVLFFSAGITRVRRYPGGETMHFRAAPNTGALYHVDLYVACGDLEGLPAGVYHYGPQDHALRRLREGDHRAALVDATGGEASIAAAPAVVLSASTYWRNAWKYRDRAYRHVFWDGGTLHAHLLAVAGALRLAPRLVLGFADPLVERLLGLDPEREGAIALVPLGREAGAPPPAPAPAALGLETESPSHRPIDYPAIREAHRASSLADGAAAARWREAVAGGAASPGEEAARDGRDLAGGAHGVRDRAAPEEGRLFPLAPRADRPAEPLESVIVRRGSTRRFDPQRAISYAELSTALEAATARVPADFLVTNATLLEHYLIVHAVDGLPSGAYRYRREERALELLRAGDFRAEAGRLGLFQELPADAAANVYSLADLDAVFARLGERGYRAAQLEGGIAGGRLYLAAYAQRFGATGLTFLDDEVSAFFDTSRAVMFLTALGRRVR
jgi:SagB-type dehydrogenase family enzyme